MKVRNYEVPADLAEAAKEFAAGKLSYFCGDAGYAIERIADLTVSYGCNDLWCRDPHGHVFLTQTGVKETDGDWPPGVEEFMSYEKGWEFAAVRGEIPTWAKEADIIARFALLAEWGLQPGPRIREVWEALLASPSCPPTLSDVSALVADASRALRAIAQS